MPDVLFKRHRSVFEPTFVMWHGGRRFDGAPQIVAKPPKGYENGPGFDTTTSIETAAKYAKGGGVVMRVVLGAPRKWLEDSDATIPLDDALAFIRGLSRIPSRADILDDLRENARRRQRSVVDAATLVNLGVNYEALGGRNCAEVCSFLTSHGVDASRSRHSGMRDWEWWVNVINPEIVAKVEVVPPAERADVADPLGRLAEESKKIESLREAMQTLCDLRVAQSVGDLMWDAVPASSWDEARDAALHEQFMSMLSGLNYSKGEIGAWLDFQALRDDVLLHCSPEGLSLLNNLREPLVQLLGTYDAASGSVPVRIEPRGRAVLRHIGADFRIEPLPASTAIVEPTVQRPRARYSVINKPSDPAEQENLRSQREQAKQAGCVAEGVPYVETLAGPDGMDFLLLPEPGHTREDVAYAAGALKRDRDVESLSCMWLERALSTENDLAF